MARGVNKVILIGNCGNDPEQRFTSSGSGVTHLSVATTESWKDRQSGERKERTEWHRVVFFGRLGEIAKDYLRKGSKVYIEGSLRTSSYEGKDGVKRYTTEIIANEMQMLDGKGGGDYSQPSQGSASSGDSWNQGGGTSGGPVDSIPEEDEIPF